MKKIILLSDGTGNSAAKQHKTNVWRLYKALDLHSRDQIAMYDDGVGSQEFLLFKLLGGAFGWGLKRNVIELYKFLCRNYEDGDKIFLFGFSRGAFTVRVLAGLIDKCGLYTGFESEHELHEFAHRSYAIYRFDNEKYRGWQFSKLLAWIWDCLRWKKEKNNSSVVDSNIEIEFIGVWDTVNAYGFPDGLKIKDFWDKCIFPLQFNDRKLSHKVRKACHAVSIDEERHTFHPVLWDESREKDSERIEQAWFPGVHCDVGGGYPRHELALVSLDWMISKVEQSTKTETDRLKFRIDLRKEYRQRCNWNGIQHDSRAGLRAFYRYKPRNIETLCKEAGAIRPPKIHQSAFERIKAQVVPYAPIGLPAEYDVVATKGTSPIFETKDEAKERHSTMKRALDIICRRQCLYWAFVVTTLIVAVPSFILWWFAALCLMIPIWFAALGLYAILGKAKKDASAKIFDRAAKAWACVKKRHRSNRLKTGVVPDTSKPTVTSQLRCISCWLIFAMILVVIVVAADRTVFYIRDCVACICGQSDAQTLETGKETVEFNTDDPCMPTELELVSGITYKFDVENVSKWMDNDLRAGPDGLVDAAPLPMKVSVPFRRHLSRPWFELTGRIGQSGGEVFTIGSGVCYTAPSTGPLYLYVNDAISGLMPGRWWAFPYFWRVGPNKGTASVTVNAIGRSSRSDETDQCISYAGLNPRIGS